MSETKKKAPQSLENAEAVENTKEVDEKATEAKIDATEAPAEVEPKPEKKKTAKKKKADKEPEEIPAATQEEPAAPAVTLEDLEAIDMGSFSEDDEEHRAPWAIRDDGCADWAVRKIAEEKEEYDRLQRLADQQISQIEQKLAEAKRRYENGTRFLTSKLAEYFDTVDHKKTKTQETYRLLNGQLVKKLGGVSMKQDNDKLLDFLKSSGLDDMIVTTEKPAWGEFKKGLEIMGDCVVIKETGEIVEGVNVVENPDTFSVKL